MGYDTKYGKVTTEFGEIPDDEPVIVFRARDKNVVDLLDEYLELCEERRSPPHHLNLIRQTQDTIRNWQNEHPDRVQVPNSNRYIERIASA
jgi:hypothetical protein